MSMLAAWFCFFLFPLLVLAAPSLVLQVVGVRPNFHRQSWVRCRYSIRSAFLPLHTHDSPQAQYRAKPRGPPATTLMPAVANVRPLSFLSVVLDQGFRVNWGYVGLSTHLVVMSPAVLPCRRHRSLADCMVHSPLSLSSSSGRGLGFRVWGRVEGKRRGSGMTKIEWGPREDPPFHLINVFLCWTKINGCKSN